MCSSLLKTRCSKKFLKWLIFQVLGKIYENLPVPHAMQFDNLFPTERVFSDPDPSPLEFTKSTESITNVGSHMKTGFCYFWVTTPSKGWRVRGGNPKRNQRCNQTRNQACSVCNALSCNARGHRCLVWKIAVKVQICELRTICAWTWSKFQMTPRRQSQ